MAVPLQAAKRPAEADTDMLGAPPTPKRARLDHPEPATQANSSCGGVSTSPPSLLSQDDVPATATSFTSRSTSTRPKKYICDYHGCNKAFNRPVRLQAHLRTHTNDRPFACEEEGCDKSFFKAEHLKAHVQNKHSDEAHYLCTYVISIDEHGEDVACGKAFTTSSRLRRHAATHERAQELKCQEAECGQVFRKIETLQRHIKKVHLEEDAFRCQQTVYDESGEMEEVCGQTFPTVGQLKSHESREHAGMKYFCSICSPPQEGEVQTVGFPTYAQYQTHLKLVHPPTCTICLLPCGSNRALAAHMEIEHSTLSSRKQNYTCPYPDCDRGFTRKGNLNVHIQSVHVKKKRFVCGESDLSGNDKCPDWDNAQGCGSAFTTKASLVGHVRTQHLHLPNLYHPRKSVKFEEPLDTATASFSGMDLDEPRGNSENAFGEGRALGLLTGHNYADTRPIECWMVDCPVRFSRKYDLTQHMELAHGWNVDDVDDYAAEKEALEGGQFWIGGADEDAGQEAAEHLALRASLSQALTLHNNDEESRRSLGGNAEVVGGLMCEAPPSVGHVDSDNMALDPALVGL